MSKVTDFWNALHIVNRTGNNLTYSVTASGNKQLFSPSQDSRNVPDGHASDTYNVTIPANGETTVGCGILRNDDGYYYDQDTKVSFNGLGVLSFSGTTKVHSYDISQVAFWSGASNVNVPTGVVWNFNHSTDPVLTITIN